MLLQFSGQDVLPSPVASCGSVFAVERVRKNQFKSNDYSGFP